jgi:DNA-binding CsgD family transcriptional regulator
MRDAKRTSGIVTVVETIASVTRMANAVGLMSPFFSPGADFWSGRSAPKAVRLSLPAISRLMYSGRRRVMEQPSCGGRVGMTGNLTPKEKECLHLAGRRLSDAEIAQRLGLSARTVGNHLARAYTKLGVHDRIRAAAKLSKLHPEYPLPVGYGADSVSPPPPSARRVDAPAGILAKAFARLPRPPSRLVRLALILAVATSVSFVFAGVTVIMSVSAERASTFAPENAR